MIETFIGHEIIPRRDCSVIVEENTFSFHFIRKQKRYIQSQSQKQRELQGVKLRSQPYGRVKNCENVHRLIPYSTDGTQTFSETNATVNLSQQSGRIRTFPCLFSAWVWKNHFNFFASFWSSDITLLCSVYYQVTELLPKNPTNLKIMYTVSSSDMVEKRYATIANTRPLLIVAPGEFPTYTL